MIFCKELSKEIFILFLENKEMLGSGRKKKKEFNKFTCIGYVNWIWLVSNLEKNILIFGSRIFLGFKPSQENCTKAFTAQTGVVIPTFIVDTTIGIFLASH